MGGNLPDGGFADVQDLVDVGGVAGRIPEQSMNCGKRKTFRRSPEAGARAIAAPCPVTRVVAEAASYRIADDVATCLREMLFALDECQAKSSLEQVATSVVALIERLRVEAVQPSDSPRQRCLGHPQHEVVVVRHQAIREAPPP